MYSTDIPHGWFVVPGVLANGEEVDLLAGGGPVPWTQPELVTAIYPSSRWIQLLHGYPRLAESPYWPSFAAYFLARPGPEGLHPVTFVEQDCE